MLANKATQLDELVNFAENHIDWNDMKVSFKRFTPEIYLYDMPETTLTKTKSKSMSRNRFVLVAFVCIFKRSCRQEQSIGIF